MGMRCCFQCPCAWLKIPWERRSPERQQKGHSFLVEMIPKPKKSAATHGAFTSGLPLWGVAIPGVFMRDVVTPFALELQKAKTWQYHRLESRRDD